MKLQKLILKNILQDINGHLIHNIPNNKLYRDLCLLYKYLIDRKINKIHISFSVFNYYKVLFILLTCYLEIEIYIGVTKKISYNWKVTNEDCKKILDKRKYEHFNIKTYFGKIYYENNNTLFILDWIKIKQFTSMSRLKLKICLTTNEIHLQDLNKIYFNYFLGYVFLNKYKLFFENDIINVNISDDINSNNSLFISHKYTLKYPSNYKNIIFYSYNIRQFLLYNVVINSSKITGKLFSIFNIHRIDNSNILVFNGSMVKLPNSYQILENNIILISKKTSKIKKSKSLVYPENLKFSNINKFLFKNSFIKRIFLNSRYTLSKIQGYKLYNILITKFPELNSKYYNIKCQNKYLYNHYQTIDNALFVFILMNNNTNSTIVIDLSYSLYNLEKYIISELDNIIKNIVFLENVKIKHTVTTNNYRYLENKIHIISELKSLYFMISILLKMSSIIFQSSLPLEEDKSIKKQLMYTFDKDEINIITQLGKNFNMEYDIIFKILIIKSVFKFFPNKIILFMNNSGIYLIPNIPFQNINSFKNKLDILFNGKIIQSFIKSFVFKIFNTSKYIERYSELFILINETVIDNDFNNSYISKINSSSLINLCSTQINYIINKNSQINVNLSFKNSNDKIKYIVSDILDI